MILGTAARRAGAPGGMGRFLIPAVCAALVLVWVVAVTGEAVARMNCVDGRACKRSQETVESRVYEFYGWYHNVGQALLHVSNLGIFGRMWWDLDAPSLEWPAGSNNEYLWAAGLWVGAIVTNDQTGLPDTLCTAAVYQQEFRPDPDDRLKTIYESWEGAANSGRYVDDDGDCSGPSGQLEGFDYFDEDPLDGVDNDIDGLVDEDYAAISQQMYRMEYEDTYEEDVNENPYNPADLHASLGLRVIQESYQWTSEKTDDFVGLSFSVINVGEETLRMAYVGFMVDADAGPDNPEIPYYIDDRGGFIDTIMVTPNPNNPTETDTLAISLCYMFDDPYGPDGNVATGYLGCMFLGHPTSDPDTLTPGNRPSAPTEVKVHAFRIWSSGAEDADSDRERYRFLRGPIPDQFQYPGCEYSADFPMYDEFDNDDDGETDEEDEWRVNIDRDAQSPQDWRLLLSAGPFTRIVPGDTLDFQYAFVMGEGLAGMLENAATVQQVYNGVWQEIPNCVGDQESLLLHWIADTPPPPPNQEMTAGDRFVRMEWDDYPEALEDPLTRIRDFYGYQIWKAVGWTRESNEPRDQDWQLILDIDRRDGGAELLEWDTGLDGIGKYCFVDNHVKNGFAYWYSVTAYDSTDEGYHYGKYSQRKTLVFPSSAVNSSLDDVIVVPNPYINHEYIARWNLWPDDADPTGEKICFQNLPKDSKVRIYSLGGELVKTLYTEAERMGGDACWNMISRNNQIIVSGVYLYHVDSPVGETIGKFAIIK